MSFGAAAESGVARFYEKDLDNARLFLLESINCVTMLVSNLYVFILKKLYSIKMNPLSAITEESEEDMSMDTIRSDALGQSLIK